MFLPPGSNTNPAPIFPYEIPLEVIVTVQHIRHEGRGDHGAPLPIREWIHDNRRADASQTRDDLRALNTGKIPSVGKNIFVNVANVGYWWAKYQEPIIDRSDGSNDQWVSLENFLKQDEKISCTCLIFRMKV